MFLLGITVLYEDKIILFILLIIDFAKNVLLHLLCIFE